MNLRLSHAGQITASLKQTVTRSNSPTFRSEDCSDRVLRIREPLTLRTPRSDVSHSQFFPFRVKNMLVDLKYTKLRKRMAIKSKARRKVIVLLLCFGMKLACHEIFGLSQ